MLETEKRLKEFDTLTYTTSAARFYAAERLKLQSQLALYASATLSLAATMQALTYSPLSNYIAAACSAFALVFSLIESSADRSVKAERLHNSGVAIRELMYKAKDNKKNICQLQRKYDDLIKLCPENHTCKDYKVAINKDSEWQQFRYWFLSYSVYWLLIMLAVLLIIIGVWNVS